MPRPGWWSVQDNSDFFVGFLVSEDSTTINKFYIRDSFRKCGNLNRQYNNFLIINEENNSSYELSDLLPNNISGTIVITNNGTFTIELPVMGL